MRVVRLAATAATAAMLLCAAAQAVSMNGAAEAAGATTTSTSTSTSYVAVQPCRLVDTRAGIGAITVDPQTFDVATRSVCGLPAGATALAVTLTVVAPTGRGYLTAWPSDQDRPTVSNINFTAGQVRANGAIVPVGPNGTFRVFTSVAAQVVVDVVGAFVPAASARAGRFVPLTPSRILDSRSAGPVAAGATIAVPLPAGVPADAIAVAVNVTVTNAAGAGFVTAFPAGQTMPQASILDLDQPRQTRAAASILPTSPNGFQLFLSAGGDVLVDVLGYFTGPTAAAGTDGLFTPVAPTRALDTRDVSPLGSDVPLYPGGGLELGTTQGGSMAYNITSVDADPGFITAYAAGIPRPATSAVNPVGGGDVVANFAVTQVSNRGLGLFSQVRSHVLVDVQGWFSGASATATIASPANPSPATPAVTYSACSDGGSAPLDQFNAARRSVHVSPLVLSSAAGQFACGYALQLAQASNGLVHSSDSARDAALGCTSGENIAYASGTSIQAVLDLWFASAPHFANLKNPSWHSVGVGFVTRTEPSGETMTWAAADFGTC